ncbi:MAG: lipocalin family protein [Verrucomicrobia bacterium]|nr:lipocalin family protein [Verrucomicrobiota bacterium]
MTHNRLSIIALLFAALLAAGCATTRQEQRELEPLRTVASIDLRAFSGSWFVIAHMPGQLDRRAVMGQEIYTLDAQGNIDVLYTFLARANAPEFTELRGRATVRNVMTFAEWLIRWDQNPFVSEQFLVLYTDEQNQVAVVSSGNRRNLRILSRSADIDPALFSDLILFLQQRDFDVASIRRMPQQ